MIKIAKIRQRENVKSNKRKKVPHMKGTLIKLSADFSAKPCRRGE